ncbi:MAG: peroxiredoxin [Campylobacterales bacterium]
MKAVDFRLQNQDGIETSLKDYRGSWVVLYFYPKDNTPGCTTEACEFSSEIDAFRELDANIIGVSKDSVKSHKNFQTKKDLKITLLSDPEKEVLKAYNAWGLKKMYGKEVEGTIRSTFVINPDGEIVAEWKNVKVKGHVQEVKEKLQELQS